MNIAIYSRKSVFTGKGESVENQIELCKNYCENYLKDKDFEYIIYEDEGFSGKNTNRPRFKELLEDIKSKKIDILICYRLDRISRNVADFSTTLELLQSNNCDFISIKEQFDTSTPMGRAMIYIASVFAQLERETIAERVKDNMVQMAKLGKWLGGQLPLGFESKKVNYMNEEMKEKYFSKLIPINEELDIVKFIYDTYLLKNSIREVTKELNLKNYKSKNGGNFDLMQVKRVLRNPLYVQSNENTHKYLNNINYNVFGNPNGNGYLTYNKKTDKDNLIVAVAAHKGIISSTDWLFIQSKLDSNRDKSSSKSGTGNSNTLFSTILKCGKCGASMVIKYNSKNKDGKNYIYYVCSNKEKKYGENKCDCPNLRSDIIDEKIINKIKAYNKDVILEAYNRKIDELASLSSKNLISNLKLQLSKTESQARNLVSKISDTLDEVTSELLMEELKSLGNKITLLKEEISNDDISKKHIENQIDNVRLLKNSFVNFDKSFENTDDIITKRALIKNIVQDIVYNITTNDFDVTFLGLKNMHFDNTSESMDCHIYSSKRRSSSGFT
ncbi:recombinase family protein [Clostridium saccharoperbutylacetonicum]|uniref:recombinase family protein n=1 Tax=Clostridium saccharoperbutylacetonicum TaxID=36745 RepID=UPI000983A7EB|nr:recombinase family protein [Clostridium saccharoperbutylacetonicum]AQR95515.1 DNA-invertase hin [Clostridium saccharoperbutylacetonicum]NSB31375.1 DNA invertase Pin-like site-specific DNA recombinase [Clostridium saccharoperbutylacetonicum]